MVRLVTVIYNLLFLLSWLLQTAHCFVNSYFLSVAGTPWGKCYSVTLILFPTSAQSLVFAFLYVSATYFSHHQPSCQSLYGAVITMVMWYFTLQRI